jgi:hypothetical protein
MLSRRALGAIGPRIAAAAPGGGNHGVRFDGTNDYLSRAGSIGADSKLGIFSCWINTANTGDANNAVLLLADTSGTLRIHRRDSGGGNLIQVLEGGGAIFLISTIPVVAADGWVHVLASWNVASSGTIKLYINDVDVTQLNASADTTITYSSTTEFVIGANSGGATKADFDVYDFYLNTATNLDLTNSTNRRKFIDGSGNPVDLGSDGSTPTGSAPALFFSGETASWHTNKGSGGAFTLNGTLAQSATDP